VVVQQGGRLLTQTAFELDMTAKIVGATSGPIGSSIDIEVQGIGWRELEGSWVFIYDNKFTGFHVGGHDRWQRPPSAFRQPGTSVGHILEVQHSDFGSP